MASQDGYTDGKLESEAGAECPGSPTQEIQASYLLCLINALSLDYPFRSCLTLSWCLHTQVSPTLLLGLHSCASVPQSDIVSPGAAESAALTQHTEGVWVPYIHPQLSSEYRHIFFPTFDP